MGVTLGVPLLVDVPEREDVCVEVTLGVPLLVDVPEREDVCVGVEVFDGVKLEVGVFEAQIGRAHV